VTTHLILGATSSGKSEHAERLACDAEAGVVYVATGRAVDDEIAERIEAHRRRRPADWRLEETTDLEDVLRRLEPHATVLVDDLGGWLTARMLAADLLTDDAVAPLGVGGGRSMQRIEEEAAAWWQLADQREGTTIVVAGQPGAGIVPTGAATRRYVDLHGRITQRLADAADHASLVVAGRALSLPPPSGTATAPPATTVDPAPVDPELQPGPDLRDHGDRQVPAGALDLAVNVLPGPPEWLRDRLVSCLDDLRAYPDDAATRDALAARHGRDAQEIVPLAGAAEGFWLLPHVLRPRLAACVHPGFTEPEAALRAAGVPVQRVQRDPQDWHLDPKAVPEDADLVVLGRPGNPTGVVEPVETIAALCRPGRTVVLDEAFADFLSDATGLALHTELPGLVVLRSMTKLWGLAGLRTGYLVCEAPLARRLVAARQPWPVDTLALTALGLLAGAEEERRERAARVAHHRRHLLDALRALPHLTVWDAGANFVLLRTPRTDLRDRLLDDGIAVRRGETFPGLDARYVRVAVRPPETSDRFVASLAPHLEDVRV
jgi:histidinol-phosphate/aromatic aminotransferase/cobyric acid decarboxylase-like protein/adenosyl cobinamide kinase/adenosyl cobinamide phosphate guanylyltransferase